MRSSIPTLVQPLEARQHKGCQARNRFRGTSTCPAMPISYGRGAGVRRGEGGGGTGVL